MQQKKRKKPLGKAIEWSADDIAEMAQVSAGDKKAASALWKNEAPAKFKNLLQAGVMQHA